MVDGVRRAGAAYGPGAAARGARGRAGFGLPAEAAGEAAAAGAVSGPNLLALQPGLDDAARDAAAGRRGGALLDELRHLQREMLDGRFTPARLARLALLAEGEAGADPGLREVVEALSLRARVQAALIAPR